MIDCIFQPNADNHLQCIQCGWVYPRPAPDDPAKYPRRNCTNPPDLKEAAERLGVASDPILPGMTQYLARWKADDYAERDDWRELSAAPCESRREDGVCNAIGCKDGEKRIRCEWLARMTVGNCQRGCFGDNRVVLRQEILEACE